MWRFSDGTQLFLGGIVLGDSPFARALKLDIEALEMGREVHVYVAAPEYRPLSLNIAYLVDLWSRALASRFKVKVVDSFEFRKPPGSFESVPGRMY
jgi:hypothetical protein